MLLLRRGAGAASGVGGPGAPAAGPEPGHGAARRQQGARHGQYTEYPPRSVTAAGETSEGRSAARNVCFERKFSCRRVVFAEALIGLKCHLRFLMCHQLNSIFDTAILRMM